jgi:glycosyltransferase involved in cell wall biosynthesis
MNKKVAILYQGFIPVYRARFYTILNQVSATRYFIYHGAPPSETAHREFGGHPDFPNVRIKNIEVSLLGRRMIYQPVIRSILFGSFDAMVIGHEIRFISNLMLLGLCKLLRKPVIWWGHGFEKNHVNDLASPLMSRAIRLAKRRLALLGDMYIVYTDGGAAKLRQWGLPESKIQVVRNTIDMEEQRATHSELIDADPLELRRKKNLRLDSKVLLYIGRIYQEKKVDELLSLVERINTEKRCRSFVEAVIIGDGPELTRLRQVGAQIEGIHFVGELYDQRVLAEYLRIASAVVIPGKVGLTVNHAFSHGVPIITRAHEYHAPEVEYIDHGVNGLIVQGDFDSFVQATADYLNSCERHKRMVKGALKTRDELMLPFMVNAFDTAVTKAIGAKNRNFLRLRRTERS